MVVTKEKKSQDKDGSLTTVTNKKVFVTLKVGPYTFKKRKEKKNRIQFTCNGYANEGK